MNTIAEFLEPLRKLHDHLRGLVVAACELQSPSELSRVAGEGGGDITYAIDRISETALVEWLTREIAVREPIVLVAEGLPGGKISLPDSSAEKSARWRVIVDPIDGTRGLMYQKRPGWILAGVAPNRGDATTLADIELAVQTEIPLVKQHLSDQAWAVRGQGVHGVRFNRLTNASQPLAFRPTAASDLQHGYATVCRFFAGGREVLAAIDDELCDRLVKRRDQQSTVFEDQYACTGGQIFGLATGQDRFIADLRPLVQSLLSARGAALGHCCHPYDLCTSLIAEEAGVVVVSPTGGPVAAPLDTETNVAWVGYANRELQNAIEPVLRELLREHLGVS